jgi:hypothetical protein
VYVLNIVKLPVIGIIINFDYTPPVYNLLAYISYTLCGGYDVAIRFPAVVCGILLTPAAYYLGREYHGELTGLYLSFFTLVILPFEYYSQYARSYILSVLFFVILLIFYIRVKRNNDDKRSELCFWILSVINVWIHLFSIIPIIFLCLDVLIQKRNIIYATISCVLLTPLLTIFNDIILTRNTSSGFNYGANMAQMIILLPLEFFNTPFLNVIALSIIGYWLDEDPLKKRLVIISFITLAAGIVLSNYTPVFPRYIMGVSIIFLLISSVACVKLTQMASEKVGKNLDYIVLIAIILIFTWMEFPNFMSHYFVQQYVC